MHVIVPRRVSILRPTEGESMVRSPSQRRAAKRTRSAWLQVPHRLRSMRLWMLAMVLVSVVLLLGNMLSIRVVSRNHESSALTLLQLAKEPAVEPRGIVLPLFDGIAVLGISLIMELREMLIDLPIEVPHCGDLDEKLQERLARDEKLNVRVYDVCVEAAQATRVNAVGIRTPLFCRDLQDCQRRFRSFDIKVISLLFSRFQELMLLDADVLFMQNPMSLWDLDKYVKTGTLFFPDRISTTDEFLAERVKVKDPRGNEVTVPERSKLHEFIEEFDRTPFQGLANVPRQTEKPKDTVKRGPQRPVFKTPQPKMEKRGKPSDFLRHTHAWSLRAGHQADSSVMLWSKTKQPRATAILGSFLALWHRPPSYGDKELYFLACEVADSEYAFSDFGVGCIGSEWDAKNRALCGDSLHFYPIKRPHIKDDDDIPPLFINSDHIASWNLDKGRFLRTSARLAEHYPGSFKEKNLPQECPFDVKPIRMKEHEKEAFRRRQRLLKIAETWLEKKSQSVSS